MVWNPLARFGRSPREEAPPPVGDPAEQPAVETAGLVPGRECGGCTACCEVLTIMTPELKKPPGVLCEHCNAGGGCQIYNARPPVCRAFQCGWRSLGVLDDAWRPDRSQIIITFPSDHIPPQYAQHSGIQFGLFGDVRKTIGWPPFVGYLIELIRNGLPVFLQVASEPGFEATRLFLNDRLIASVALRDYGRVILDLARVVAECEAAEKTRAVVA
jgi:hypothetical protein